MQIPTTLLSQIDSSIGGKVGVDYGGYKNILAFYFPEKFLQILVFYIHYPKEKSPLD